MKKAFLIIAACLSTVLFSCKKDKDTKPSSPETVKSDVADTTLIADRGWPGQPGAARRPRAATGPPPAPAPPSPVPP